MSRFEYLLYGDFWTDRPMREVSLSDYKFGYASDSIILENDLRYDLFGSKDTYDSGGKRVFVAYNTIISDLSHDLDEIHHTEYGRDFWEPMLAHWLYSYICTAYITYEELCYLSKLQEPVYTFVPRERFIDNSANFMANSNSVKYDQIRADIICAVKKIEYEYEIKFLFSNTLSKNHMNEPHKNTISIWDNLVDARFSTGLLFPYINSIWDAAWKCISFGSIRKIPINEFESTISFIDYEKRKKLKRHYDDAFLDIAYNCLYKNLPALVFEGLDDLRREYQKRKTKVPRLLVSSVAILTPMGAMLYADVKKSGGKVLLVQHGGSYRYEKYAGYYDMQLGDLFYAAGCGGQGTVLWKKCHMKSMPFGKTLGIYRGVRHTGRIMIACDVTPAYLARFYIYAVFEMKRYYMSEDIFLEKLDERTINKVYVRIWNVDYNDGINRYESIKSIRSDIVFDEIPNFYNSLKQADMVIAFYISTPVIEAINLGIPVLIVLQDDRICIEEGAEDIIARMKSVGIIITDAKEAARYLSNIADDIWGWWNAPFRRKVWHEFRNMYCRRAIFGRCMWVKEIMKENRLCSR